MPDYNRIKNKSIYTTTNSEYDSVDVDFTFEGDFAIGKAYGGNVELSRREKDELVSLEGDIRVVGNKYGSVGRNIVIKRLNSSKGEWALDSNCGSNLENFYGVNMSRQSFDSLKAAIIQSLTYDSLILEKNLTVEVLPINQQEIKIAILIKNEFDENFEMITTHFSGSENRFNKFS